MKKLFLLVAIVMVAGIAHAQSCSEGASCIADPTLVYPDPYTCGCGLTCAPVDSQFPDANLSTCTNLQSDLANCGAVGHNCGGATPFCCNGTCYAGGSCPSGPNGRRTNPPPPSLTRLRGIAIRVEHPRIDWKQL